MQDTRGREPTVDKAIHSLPVETGLLTPPTQSPVPLPRHLSSEGSDRVPVARNGMVVAIPHYHRADPFTLLWDRLMHACPEPRLYVAKLGCQPVTPRFMLGATLPHQKSSFDRKIV